ncbi:hypothetical protein [Thermoflexus sp.]|uniref:hypothetical protein n=1 Tax=Thermoflexus sp. TaxID=1969742 RepID=UPI002ADDFBDD|nr:hypothetical protein [Thermoflexus sp.]
MSIWEFLGAVFGLIRGLLALVALVLAGGALIVAAFGRLIGLDVFSRTWDRLREILLRAALIWVLAVFGLIFGSRFPDLLGHSPEAMVNMLVGTVGVGLLAFLLIPRRPRRIWKKPEGLERPEEPETLRRRGAAIARRKRRPRSEMQ